MSENENLFSDITLEDAKTILMHCDSYSRLPTLLEISWRMNDDDWIYLLGHWWPSMDNIGKFIDELIDSPFGVQNSVIYGMMTDEDIAVYHALPDTVTLYRGCYSNNKWGFSWSLSQDVAETFPLIGRYWQHGHQPLLVKAIVKKEAILAVKTDRDESEIITWRPKHISTRHIKAPWVVKPTKIE